MRNAPSVPVRSSQAIRFFSAALGISACTTCFAQSPIASRNADAVVPAVSDAVERCVEAGAGAVFQDINGPLLQENGFAASVTLFATPERTSLDIFACPDVKDSPRSATALALLVGSEGLFQRQRSGGTASVRVQCEAPPPIWLLDRAIKASQGQLKEFGAPDDWILSCEKIVVLSDDGGTGFVVESNAANMSGFSAWKQPASYRYPRLQFTLKPANERRGQPQEQVELDLGAFADFDTRLLIDVGSNFAAPKPYSPAHVQLTAALPTSAVSPCGFTKADDPNSVSPFRVSFSAYSPRGAIACGVAIATQGIDKEAERIKRLEDRLKCLEVGTPCPPPSR